jgi:hypothetical protein
MDLEKKRGELNLAVAAELILAPLDKKGTDLLESSKPDSKSAVVSYHRFFELGHPAATGGPQHQLRVLVM